MNKKEIEPKVPVNRRKFFLTNTSNPEDHGFSREQVEDMLDIVANYDEHEDFNDPDFVNSIGTFFEDGVCIEKDIEQAVYWYERAVALDDDLAAGYDLMRELVYDTKVDNPEKLLEQVQAQQVHLNFVEELAQHN